MNQTPGSTETGLSLAAACARIGAHFAEIARELEELEKVGGFTVDSLACLGDHEQSHGVDAPSIAARRITMNSSSTSMAARRYYTLAEVATVLSLDSRSLRRLRRDSTAKFPAARQFGRALRWKAAEIDAWAERQRSKP